MRSPPGVRVGVARRSSNSTRFSSPWAGAWVDHEVGEQAWRVRTMINGAHVIVYSKDAEADKAFIKNVLKFKYVDVHDGWLIFKLPPAEVAVHPSDENDRHDFYLMTDDLDAEMAALKQAGVACEDV